MDARAKSLSVGVSSSNSTLVVYIVDIHQEA